MSYSYYEMIEKLEELIALETSNGNRMFTLGICILVVVCFSIFRRKEHI